MTSVAGRGLQTASGGTPSASSDSLDANTVFWVVFCSCLVAGMLLYQLSKMRRRWRNCERSAKVLDEIEMEFVNDMDDEELLRNVDYRWSPACALTAPPWRHTERACVQRLS